MGSDDTSHGPNWLVAIRRYALAVAIGNAVWETAQLPLYSLWQSASPRTIVVAVLHCTAGDVMIALAALVGGLLLVGSSNWPQTGVGRTTITALAIGITYTIYSEYLNTTVRGTWQYSKFMPTLPWFGVGLSPLAQWLVVPVLALAWATRPWSTATGGRNTSDATKHPSSAAHQHDPRYGHHLGEPP